MPSSADSEVHNHPDASETISSLQDSDPAQVGASPDISLIAASDDGGLLSQSERREKLSPSLLPRRLAASGGSMQRLPSGVFQKIQQQGARQTPRGSEGARSIKERRRGRPPRIEATEQSTSTKSPHPPPSASQLCSYSKSLCLSIESLQQGIETNTSRNRDGQKSATISPINIGEERTSPNSRANREAWWLPSSPAEYNSGGSPRTEPSLSPERSSHDGTGEVLKIALPDPPTPASTPSNASDKSNESSLAYIAHDRHRDTRMLRLLTSHRKSTVKDEHGEHPQSTIPIGSPRCMIVEDSRDYVLAQSASLQERSSPVRRPQTLKDGQKSFASSILKRPHAKSSSIASSTASGASQQRGNRTRTHKSFHTHVKEILTAQASRSTFLTPDLSPQTSRPSIERLLPRPTSAPASTVYELPHASSGSVRRRSAPCPTSNASTRDRSGEELRTQPSFQTDEQYFEALAAHGQKSFTPSITPDSDRKPVPFGERPDRRDFQPMSMFEGRSRQLTSRSSNTRQRKRYRCCGWVWSREQPDKDDADMV